MTDSETRGTILQDIEHRLEQNAVVLFMKGTPDAPRCGFSAGVVEIFERIGVRYEAVDVLTDPLIREVLSEHSGWPTIPQVFIQGQLIGGGDIIRELDASGGLKARIEAALVG